MRNLSCCVSIAMLTSLSVVLAAPAHAAMRWGINPGMAESTQLVNSTYGQDAVREMALAGLREARYPAPWYIADPDGKADRPGGRYLWSTYFDSVATVLAKNLMRWDPMFLYAPAIYSADPLGGSGGNPTRTSYSYFANFVQAFAKRYGKGGDFWKANPTLPALPVTDYEIWNEPNVVGGWATPETAPQDYMDLYAVARTAIKGVDRSARVMFASLTPSPGAEDERSFLAAAVAHRPIQPIDEVGYHPNTIGIGTHGAIDHVYRLLRPFRDGMDALGLQGVPISVTELAWGSEYTLFPDSSVTLTEAERAAAMSTVGTALANSDCNINLVSMLFWGTDKVVTSFSVDPERYLPTVFALANTDNTLKPIGQAYRSVIAATPPTTAAAICH
jgi:hypothetical protein